ncbi:MAG: DUF255 domain-containing protein [Acidobacteria bacterium]|nr:MAG: DUF255 domain-containing protein [Acidobacteriota bacterium]
MRGLKVILSAAFILFVAFFTVFSQSPVVWTIEGDDLKLKTNQRIEVQLKAKIEKGWYVYALNQPEGNGPVPLRISLPEDSLFRLDGEIEAPKPLSKIDQNFNIESKFFVEEATFRVPLKAVEDVDLSSLRINVRYQACNDTVCLPPKTIVISFDGTVTSPNANKALDFNSKDLQTLSPSLSSEDVKREVSQMPLGSFLWLAITLGALSLLTPCVFPMIPITVSYFTNQASKSKTKALKLAFIYSIGIISTFTLLGMLIAIFIGAAGVNLFAANPWVNLFIAAIFLLFAFNLFGAYEINIPTSVLTRLDKLARSKEGEGSVIVGTLLMGLTFTLTSFTCTSPFVGTILVAASQGSWQVPLIGMLAFSVVFAIPFFILALIPQTLASLPKAGGWMNAIKVSMGFLEVAAALKFISNADVVWRWGIFDRTVVLAFWVAIGLIMTLYLLGRFQLFHDSKTERIGAVRLTAAIAALAISLYLLTGLFGAPLGELESFLPPDISPKTSSATLKSSERLEWIENDLEKAKQRARVEGKRIFIDFTGYTCTNCRWMEANMFTKPEVEAELRKFILVKLFTDGQGEIYQRQQRFQEEKFKTVALPFYAIIESDESVINTFSGLTRDPKEFINFLTQGLSSKSER